MDSIFNYDHPFVTVDGVILRYVDSNMEVLLHKRMQGPEEGRWALPGGFVGVEARMEDTLKQKIVEKTGLTEFYMEQLKTYDGFERDPRGRVISVAYLGLLYQPDAPGDWFSIHGNTLIRHTDRVPEGVYDEKAEKLVFSGLAFDHGNIIMDGLERLAGKLWYSDLPKYLMPGKFPLRELAGLYRELEHRSRNNFARTLGSRVERTGEYTEPEGPLGRPAELYIWRGVDP